MHLTFGADHRENPTQKYEVQLTLTLETTAAEAGGVGGLVAIAIEGADFTPQTPHALRNFNILLGSDNFELDRFPHAALNPRDQRGSIKALDHFHQSLGFIAHRSPQIALPPPIMNHQFNAIHVFLVPQSLIGRNLRLHMVFGGGGVPSLAADQPNEAYGMTGGLDQSLRTSLLDQKHRPAPATLTFRAHPNQPYLKAFAATLRVSCHPLDGGSLQRRAPPPAVDALGLQDPLAVNLGYLIEAG